MNGPGPHAPDRIVVLLDPRHPSEVALAAARAIAPGLAPHVHGMLIEDHNVIRLGALGEAREVTLGAAQLRVPDAAALERQLRAAAREVQRMFERAATGLTGAATFEILRGQPIGELMRAASGARALLLGRARAPAAREWWDSELARLLAADVGDLAFVSAEAPTPQDLVAFAGDGGTAEVARLAARIAERTHLGLLRLPGKAATLDLRRQTATVRYLVVPARTTEAAGLRELLRVWRCTIVIAR